MRARRVLVLVAGICLGCAAGGAGAYFFLLPLLFPGPDIEARILAVDNLIAGGSLSTATAALLEIRPRNEGEALRVLKRAFVLSKKAGNYNLLADAADNAQESVPSSASVRLVAAYAYLRVGRLSEAEAAARRGFPSGTGELVRAEISLKRGGIWHGSDSVTRQLLELESSRRPSDFLAAARVVDDKRINLDAALLMLEKGDLAGARQVSVSSLQDQAFDEPAGLIAYDAGDFETALARLTRLESRLQAAGFPRADVELLVADCYHALGKSANAAGALQDAIRIDQRTSWTPYADLGLMAEQRGNAAAADEIFGQGRAVFPGSRDLTLLSARLDALRGNPDAAIALLNGLVSERPKDAEAALFLLGLRTPSLTAQAYRVELWRLFDRVASDRTVFLTLAAALMASHDWEGVAIAIHQHELAAGTQDLDTLSYRGAVETMQGKEAQAAREFQQAVALDASGKARYNLAVLSLHQGQAQEALGNLAVAAEQAASAAEGTPDALFAARIQTLRGLCLKKTGDLAAARSAFLKARALDPRDLEAGFEIRKLEAQEYQ
ncbi:MAG TPA: tetratricopeptide repeat protein [Spirochaetia bacterium]|nr:tetratricopeptide repeat protein [Spirochaetia bacterium]